MRWIINACFPLLSILVITSIVVYAADCDSLPTIIEEAKNVCAEVQRGEMCLGSGPVKLQGVDSEEIELLVGNSVDSNTIQQFELDTADSIIVVAAQASFPDIPFEQNVQLIFFGMVTVENQTAAAVFGPPRTLITVNTAGDLANIRSLPSRSGQVVASAPDNAQLTATGISEDSSWLRVQLPEDPTAAGWIFLDLVNATTDLNLLEVATVEDPVPQYPAFNPMQSFTIQTSSEVGCAGVLIEVPQNSGLVTLEVNDKQLDLIDAAIYLHADSDELAIYGLHGTTFATIAENRSVLGTGMTFTITNEDSITEPVGYDEASLQTVPIAGLSAIDTIPAAASAETIANLIGTPLSGIWYQPPYSSPQTTDDCGYLAEAEERYYEMQASEDGTSLSWYNARFGLSFTMMRTAPGQYDSDGYVWQALSPTAMTLTYNAVSEPCVSMATVFHYWVGPLEQ
jgi:hypothetical protein